MDVDELQSVQSRERQTDSLQQLRESFYEEASAYIEQLRQARDDAAERADDPWNSPEVSQLSDEIDTAEQTVEAIYDRRTGKIVKKASLAAAGMPAEEDGLTTEERALFESLVEQIQDNREHVLDKVAGDIAPESTPEHTAAATDAARTETTEADRAPPAPSVNEDQTDEARPPADDVDTAPPVVDDPAASPGDGDVSAADLMGDGDAPEAATADGEDVPPPPPPEAPARENGAQRSTDADTAPAPPSDEPSTAASPSAESASDDRGTEAVERTTVRITDDVGPIYGVDDREYDLSRDDVVTLPDANAAPLLDNDAAETF